MPSKKRAFPDDQWVRDILKAKISQSAKLQRMTVLAQRLENDLSTILTDRNYEGGVQYWIAKHDAAVQQALRISHALLYNQARVAVLFKALSRPKLRPHAKALFREFKAAQARSRRRRSAKP